jgi:hypothetical protein
LELPIDHFRLLGVSPTTDGQTVLRTLQQRLDRAPDQGFTHDTLQARADLLRSSAELLSDEERRHAYERELTSIADSDGGAVAGLEIPPSREVGGLLLLLEAGQALEAFDAASRGLQPPQAPALGSSREADLSLLAGLACHAAAGDYRSQRHYETAARTLQQGLQLLQRMGQLPDQRRRLEQELNALLPYRVLDLISRDLSAVAARQEGIGLLDQLVQRRGGLEGDGDPAFPAAEFAPFFQQIRQFLTVQEQVDLFSRWAEAGSSSADWLASLALTASGFMQRKPERIQAALQRLQSETQPGREAAQACQLLLLGQVESAQSLQPVSSAGGEDPLAGLCADCRDWLSRDVLPGFRDIEAEADLEAWFADRDVQAYIEQQDRIRGRRTANEASSSSPNLSGSDQNGLPWGGFAGFGTGATSTGNPAAVESGSSPLSGAGASRFDQADDDEDPDDDALWDGPPFWESWRLGERLSLWRNRLPAHWPRWSVPAGAAIAVAVVGGVTWIILRPGLDRGRPIPVQPSPALSTGKPANTTGNPAGSPTAGSPLTGSPPAVAPAEAASSSNLPLTTAEPDDAQLKALLEAWLKAKASVLAGREAAQPLSDLARPLQIERLESQQRENRSRGEVESFDASVQSLEIRERNPKRIAAAVSLRYSDQRSDASGRVLSRTPAGELRNLYVFARDGQTWRVAAFRPGS